MPEPLPSVRLEWAFTRNILGELFRVDGLNLAGLVELRHLLRHQGRWQGLEDLHVDRAMHLDAVCRRLAQLDPVGHPLEAFRALGDLIDEAPADPSGLGA